MCSSASFICSCGTEFTEYKDMLEHSTTHEPGHQVLDHETIRKRRNEKRKEEDEKLKRLQKGEVVWKAPTEGNIPSVSLPGKPVLHASNTSALMSKVPVQAGKISQLPELHSSLSQASLLSNPAPSVKGMQNIFASVGAPTVDLWTLYQPVVLLKTIRKFNMKKPYTCGKCGQGFMSKVSLISHHSSHVTDKVSGCIGCGLLLSSKKLVPRFHACNTSNNQTKFRLITARPLNYKAPNEAGKRQNQALLPPQAASLLQFQNQNPSVVTKGGRALQATSTQTLKIQNIRTYNNHNRGLHATPPLQLKSQNLSASRPSTGVSLPSKSQHPSVSNKNSQERAVTPSVQLRMPTNSASVVLSKPTGACVVNGFPCRVCHLPFETPQMLQRHKCARAQEFMATHMVGGKRHFKLKRMATGASPKSPQMNERKLAYSPVNTKNQLMAVDLDKGKQGVPINGEIGGDVDDDCYIVEGGSNNPAEMIYQVTSSVPIKT